MLVIKFLFQYFSTARWLGCALDWTPLRTTRILTSAVVKTQACASKGAFGRSFWKLNRPCTLSSSRVYADLAARDIQVAVGGDTKSVRRTINPRNENSFLGRIAINAYGISKYLLLLEKSATQRVRPSGVGAIQFGRAIFSVISERLPDGVT